MMLIWLIVVGRKHLVFATLWINIHWHPVPLEMLNVSPPALRSLTIQLSLAMTESFQISISFYYHWVRGQSAVWPFLGYNKYMWTVSLLHEFLLCLKGIVFLFFFMLGFTRHLCLICILPVVDNGELALCVEKHSELAGSRAKYCCKWHQQQHIL